MLSLAFKRGPQHLRHFHFKQKPQCSKLSAKLITSIFTSTLTLTCPLLSSVTSFVYHGKMSHNLIIGLALKKKKEKKKLHHSQSLSTNMSNLLWFPWFYKDSKE